MRRAPAKSIKHKADELFSKGYTYQEVHEMIPESTLRTLRNYQWMYEQEHGKVKSKEPDISINTDVDDPEDETEIVANPYLIPTPRMTEEQLRINVGSGARFGQSTTFWRVIR